MDLRREWAVFSNHSLSFSSKTCFANLKVTTSNWLHCIVQQIRSCMEKSREQEIERFFKNGWW